MLEIAAAQRTHPTRLPACTFVIPCLNEALSLPQVLVTVRKIRPHFESLDVIVVDNGSADDSVSIAESFGVHVLHCATRGYGAALRAGIEAAKQELVVFADADGTYDWAEALILVQTMGETQADLVVGNRFKGKMEPKAMPWLHRRLGTPFLSLLISIFFGFRRGVLVGDCNGGLRLLRKRAFCNWGVTATGMEFASEMIVCALKAGARYAEAPISYGRSAPGRVSHLRPWRDGFKHFYVILSLF